MFTPFGLYMGLKRVSFGAVRFKEDKVHRNDDDRRAKVEEAKQHVERYTKEATRHDV